MFARKLALTVATAALITAGTLPAKAVNDVRFYFSTTIPGNVTGGTPSQNLLSGYFTTNNVAKTITGFVGTLGGNAVTTNSVSGSYFTTSSLIAQISSLNFNYNSVGSPLGNLPYTMYGVTYANPAAKDGTVVTLNNVFVSGASLATIYPLLMPEINAGVLPKGLFVIAGAFLMLFGRSKTSEA